MDHNSQYTSGEHLLSSFAETTRFYAMPAEHIAAEIARKLHGLWDWRGSTKVIYAPSGLERLANQWLRHNTPTTMAGDAHVRELTFGNGESKYVPLWKLRGQYRPLRRLHPQ